MYRPFDGQIPPFFSQLLSHKTGDFGEIQQLSVSIVPQDGNHPRTTAPLFLIIFIQVGNAIFMVMAGRGGLALVLFDEVVFELEGVILQGCQLSSFDFGWSYEIGTDSCFGIPDRQLSGIFVPLHSSIAPVAQDGSGKLVVTAGEQLLNFVFSNTFDRTAVYNQVIPFSVG